MLLKNAPNDKVFRYILRKKKERPIRYASRRDAYIFSYYRYLLSEKYEAELNTLGVSNCVIGYRKIPVDGELNRGKCNIHFAKDAFDAVSELGDCCAIALDISSYFENIDHQILRKIWCRLLAVDELPPDHEHVFKNITRYAVVDREEVYQRLGYYGPKPSSNWIPTMSSRNCLRRGSVLSFLS